MALYDYTIYVYRGPKGSCELEEREYKNGTYCIKIGQRTFYPRERMVSDSDVQAYIASAIGTPNKGRPYYSVTDGAKPRYHYKSTIELFADMDTSKY